MRREGGTSHMAGAKKGNDRKKGPSRRAKSKPQLSDEEKARRAADIRRVLGRR